MFTLRLATDVVGPEDTDLAFDSHTADRHELMVWAVPTQRGHSMRIPTSIGLRVDHLAYGGAEVRCNEPLAVGSRLSLQFPTSPFLPRSGIIARVDDCFSTGDDYAVCLSYEAASVA